MNYIYDLYLNFNEILYDFFDWNKNDILTHIKAIPIFKIKEKDLCNLINNNIIINQEFFKNIYHKTCIWSKNKDFKNCALFCNNDNIIAIEFDSNGKSIKKSSLYISEELETLEETHKLKEHQIGYTIINKTKNILKTRKQINDENFIKTELKNTNAKKLYYIYFECFNKHEKNKEIITKKLLNLSKNSKKYKKLYDILKLTSSNNK